MSNSRTEILKSVRRHLPESSPRPPLDGPWIEYADRFEQFRAVMELIGGSAVRAPNLAAVAEHWGSQESVHAGSLVVAGVAGIAGPKFAAASELPADRFPEIDCAILPGRFAVAENAAVWVSSNDVPHRALYFVCEHLALVVPAASIVANMHQAYERLSWGRAEFGAFIAGPSKTADIEQSLVIGAHGPRSTMVYLVDDLPVASTSPN